MMNIFLGPFHFKFQRLNWIRRNFISWHLIIIFDNTSFVILESKYLLTKSRNN
ncbi:MAG: hypothetical protein A4E49_00138 [Methanosaeta sp. PtaU1.Bin112]|nr:MAG: hypothetical protein A4E49_00138 [Methanosaeta sp. PtaU1.Bin112]